MTVKLREYPSQKQLAEMYAKPHDHTRWPDHLIRVDATIAVARWMSDGRAEAVGLTQCNSGADLSCGNGTILKALPLVKKYFGDLAPGYDLCGPLEETIHKIPKVDVFIFSETIEHLQCPAEALSLIRDKAKRLVLSTPISAGAADENVEHIWAFEIADVSKMLAESGFTVKTRVDVKFPSSAYNWQIWGCV